MFNLRDDAKYIKMRTDFSHKTYLSEVKMKHLVLENERENLFVFCFLLKIFYFASILFCKSFFSVFGLSSKSSLTSQNLTTKIIHLQFLIILAIVVWRKKRSRQFLDSYYVLRRWNSILFVSACFWACFWSRFWLFVRYCFDFFSHIPLIFFLSFLNWWIISEE